MPSPRSRRMHGEQAAHLVVVEAGGGLVEDQHLASTLERARDRHHLLHRDRIAARAAA